MTDDYGEGLDLDPSLHTVEGHPEQTHGKLATKVVVDSDIRCSGQVEIRSEPGEFKVCHRLLAVKAARPWEIGCPRCKHMNVSPIA